MSKQKGNQVKGRLANHISDNELIPTINTTQLNSNQKWLQVERSKYILHIQNKWPTGSWRHTYMFNNASISKKNY